MCHSILVHSGGWGNLPRPHKKPVCLLIDVCLPMLVWEKNIFLCRTQTFFCVWDEHLYIHTGHSALYRYWLLAPFWPFSAWNSTNQLYWSRRLVCTTHGGVRKHSWPLLTILSSSSSCFLLPSIAFHPLQGYPGSWYSVYNLILTSLDDLCKQDSVTSITVLTMVR